MLARMGGDEFVVVLPGVALEPAQEIARSLRGCLEEPFVLDGNRLHVRASVGIASCRLHDDQPADLLRQADVAMGDAKKSGAGLAVYDPRKDHNSAHRLRRIDELRRALERGDLEVHLQPQVDLGTGALVGAEALARWRHPQDGVLLPDAFLPLAAQTGLMGPVAALVLDRALAACASWWLQGYYLPVGVNLTADDLRDPDLPGLVTSSLRRHLLPPVALRVEITEEALLHDPAATAALLERWRADGVSVAIDDYGTGYSSLAYLRELPVDELKLDRTFAHDLDRRTTATIVKHTVAMAHGLQLRVVAEGVEDPVTARVLSELGCDTGQGLYFGAAMSTEDFLALLHSRD
jgi:diguanylate cyclase